MTQKPRAMRLFAALPLSAEFQARLKELKERLEGIFPKARFARPEGTHLTLFFLGSVEEARLPALAEALRQACEGRRAFVLSAEGLGFFPSPRRARVLWAGVKGTSEEDMRALAELQAAVSAALVNLGFPDEGRAFVPHLTLARFRASPPAGAVEKALRRHADWAGGEWPCGVLHLYESLLHPSGAEYRVVESFPLAGA